MLPDAISPATVNQTVDPNLTDVKLFEIKGVCPNCQEQKVGAICHSCGAEAVNHHELALNHFLHHSLHEFTHIEDSKVLRTIKALLVKPGFLATEYFAGRKIRYLSPVRVFLIVFALFLLVYSNFQTNTMYSITDMLKRDKSGGIENRISRIEKERNISRTEFIQQFNTSWQKWVSSLQFLLILFISMALKILYRRRYLVEHIVFALYYVSWSLIVAIAFRPIYYYTGYNSIFLRVISFLIVSIYLSLALRAMYKQKWSVTIPKAIVMWGVYNLSHIVIYFITLYATLHTF